MSSTVAILGAGGLGAAYASQFYNMDSASVAFIAAGERYERLKREGIIVNDTRYAIPVLGPDDPVSPADLILVALKHHQLASALPLLSRHMGDDTTILSVMNGLDSEEIIGAMYGMQHVVYAIAVGIDAQRTGNRITFSKLGKLVFGEADNAELSARVRRIQALLDAAQIPYDTPQDMLRMMWWKFMVNVGINQTSAILRAPYHVFQTSAHAQAIMEAAMHEVIALAQAARVNLVPDDIAEWYEILATLHPEGKTSMLQDIEAGRATEVDIFAGKVVTLGAAHGIPTPVNGVLLHAIKTLENHAS